MGGCFSFFCGCCSHAEHDPKGTTLVTKRACTDKLLLLLYLVAWAASIAVVVIARGWGGDPDKIIRGINFQGEICGKSAAVRDLPYAALINPLTLDDNTLNVWTCVASCTDTKNPNSTHFAALYGSTELFGYCIPTFDFDQGSSIAVDFKVKSQFDNQFQSLSAEVSRGVADVANAWQIILASALFALGFAYLWMWLSKRLAGVIIWTCIILVAIGGFFLGWSFLKAAGEADSEAVSTNRVRAYRVAGYLFIAASSLFVLVILALSGQIRTAVEVVKEGSRAINDMKLLVFFPLLPLALGAAYCVYWIYGALFIFSVSDLKEQPMPAAMIVRESSLHTWAYYGAWEKEGTPIIENMAYNLSTYDINTSYRPLAAYHFFHLLWSLQFLIYAGYFVIAGAVCAWYFTLSDANGNKIIGLDKTSGSYMPITASVWRTIRYHLGTIAFASLIIAVIQFVRAVVKYIELKTRTNPPNYLQKAVFCVIQCCLKCIECCCDKISKNALIWCAMWGDPFLSSAFGSFSLIWRNLARVAAVHVVSDVILTIGKLAIAAMTVGLSALILANTDPWRTTVSSAFVPSILIAILAYGVASLFFLTFETVIDATFLCFLVDAENAEKNHEAMFASRGLQELVGKYQLRSAMTSEDIKKDKKEMYQHVNGQKVVDEHEAAVAQLDRAITAKRASGGAGSIATIVAVAPKSREVASVAGVTLEHHPTASHKQAWS